MKNGYLIPSVVLVLVLSATSVAAPQKVKLGDNAALRYWSAFAEMKDVPITDEQAKGLDAILEGKTPYDDSKYKELVEKNKTALDTMARGTLIPDCDWGVDYALGPDAPIDYVPKATALARLNVLYVFHLQAVGNRDASVRALTAGLRFSRDIANGGSLLPTLLAKDSLVKHFRVVSILSFGGSMTASQRLSFQNALDKLGMSPLDWQSAIRREMEVFSQLGWPASAPLDRIIQAYVDALGDSSKLPKLQQMIGSLPQPLQGIIVNPKRVLDEEQDLNNKITAARSVLR
jgi:hypothetical protein